MGVGTLLASVASEATHVTLLAELGHPERSTHVPGEMPVLVTVGNIKGSE